MINEQYERAKELLREHKEGHAELAKILMEREVIFAEDVEKIFGKRPWASRSEEIFADNKTTDENITEETQPAETAENKENISEETATA